MNHLCHARGCRRHVLPSLLFCAWHWKRTRFEVRRAIWREYRNGQERRKSPSVRYLAVMKLALAELAHSPGDPEAQAWVERTLDEGEKYRLLSVQRGTGDPYDGLPMLSLRSSQQVLPLWGDGR